MLKKVAGLVAGVAGLALFVAPHAVAGASVDRATGGGQTLVGSAAGNTIAFQAQDVAATGTDASGTLQIVDRPGGTGQGQTVARGSVVCLQVKKNMAVLTGNWTSGLEGTFKLAVVDNGEGAAADNDTIMLDEQSSDPDCSNNSNNNGSTVDLARGNAQVYDNGQ